MTRDLDLYGLAANSFFQVQLQRVAQIRTTGSPAATTAATEDVTKYVPEDIGEAGTTATAAEAATGLAVNAGVTELVVGGAFRIVGQNLVASLASLNLFSRRCRPGYGRGDTSSRACDKLA